MNSCYKTILWWGWKTRWKIWSRIWRMVGGCRGIFYNGVRK